MLKIFYRTGTGTTNNVWHDVDCIIMFEKYECSILFKIGCSIRIVTKKTKNLNIIF